MKNRAIEIHDSALQEIIVEGDAAVLHFPHVYIHESEGRPGVDAGTGWSQEAVLRIGNARVEGSFPDGNREALAGCNDDVFCLNDGVLVINGAVSDNMIPIPLDVSGDVKLKLVCWSNAVHISGTSAKLELIGEAEYVEDFDPKPHAS